MSAPKSNRKKLASEIGFITYAILFMSSGCVMGVPSDCKPLFFGMTVSACVPIIFGPLTYRLVGVLALGFALLLTMGDYKGKGYQKPDHRFPPATNSQP